MIEDCKVDRFTGSGQFTRGAIVSFAWPGVSAWVIMGNDYAGAAET